MSCDYIALANQGVQGLSPYQAGKPIEELQRELGLKHIVKLASNENPLGPSPNVLAAVDKAAAEIARYPDSNGFELKAALANKLGVAAEQITLGNGSNDVLELITRAYIEPGKSAVYSQHAFIVYPLAIQACSGRSIVTKAKDWGHDLNAMADAIADDTQLLFIANPNNPTGTVVDEASLVNFLDKVPANVVVVLDEAYFEYVEASDDDSVDGVALLKHYPNLIVTRTFSKAYGLAALRVGYAIASPEITDVLNRVRAPFNVNSMALAAAQAVLADDEYLQQGRQVNAEGMKQLTQGFDTLGLTYIPSAGNFIAVEFATDTAELYQKLLKEGVIVRPVGIYEMPNHLRVSIGLEAENTALLDALKKVL
ncbi:histidinol-phosphate transaminase [Oceanicoccus sagamiensis]|uniref:Histidinol-phosphate aminotransferase n=1 Tax=Oceanicoccus sagamiensis TaxID=716816 RepID=A0A1X9N8Z9_9GAMM|nr:histidinol-phosphate transaminase [Oceanicoccus sagamiensis]ARN72912.1 histidinol-phosphate transaminase [Oceanicoccus sagamiensis]